MIILMSLLMSLLFVAAIAVQTYTEKSWVMFTLLAAGCAVYFFGVAS